MNIINQYTKMCIGKDALNILGDIKKSRILIVSDEFLVKNHIVDRVVEAIDSSNEIKIFDQVRPDPTLDIVSNAIKDMLFFQAKYIIGFGGGSAIDTAKGLIYFLKESKNIDDSVKFIAIPTTSGTGSEVTSVTVITDSQKQTKHLLASEDILPDIAILDAEFTKGLPPKVVANTGMDVFTHAMEAYVAKGANEFSDAMVEKSGELVVRYLYRSYSSREDDIAKEKMHIASTIAGHAFNIAGLGVNHSIAHQLGGIFHIPHGLANAILLTHVIDLNCKDKETKQKYIKFAKKTGIVTDHIEEDEGIKILKKYIQSMLLLMEMPLSVSQCNVGRDDWERELDNIAKNALKDNCLQYNPVEVTEKDIVAILEQIY